MAPFGLKIIRGKGRVRRGRVLSEMKDAMDDDVDRTKVRVAGPTETNDFAADAAFLGGEG